MNLADLRAIGRVYQINDLSGKKLREFRVIEMDEILEATLGEYDENKHGDISTYMLNCVAMLTGFTVDLSDISWVSLRECDSETFNMTDLAKQCMEDDTSIVILEFVDE